MKIIQKTTRLYCWIHNDLTCEYIRIFLNKPDWKDYMRCHEDFQISRKKWIRNFGKESLPSYGKSKRIRLTITIDKASKEFLM